MRRFLLATLFVVPAALLAVLEFQTHRSLSAVEQDWTERSRQFQTEGATLATSRFAALQRRLSGRLEKLAPTLRPTLEQDKSKSKLRALIAAQRPALAPEGFEIRDARGACLAWSGRPPASGLPTSPVTDDGTGPMLVVTQRVGAWTLLLYHPLTAGLMAQHPSVDFQQNLTREFGRAVRVRFGKADEDERDSGSLTIPLKTREGLRVGQVSVPPVNLEAEMRRIRKRTGLYRLALTGLLLLLVALWIGGRIGASRHGPGLRFGCGCLLIAGVALLILQVDLTRLLPEEPIVGPTYYSDSQLGLIARSPLTLLVTLFALLGMVFAARQLLWPTGPSAAWRLRNLGVVFATTLGATSVVWLFIKLIENIVNSSTQVDFFPTTQVVPGAPALLLQLGIFFAAVASLMAADLLLEHARRALAALGAPVAWSASLFAMMLLTGAAGALGAWPSGLRLPVTLIGLVWFSALLLVLLRESRWVARFLVLLLAASALAHPTLAGAIQSKLMADATYEASTFDWQEEAGQREALTLKLELAVDAMAEALDGRLAGVKLSEARKQTQLSFQLWSDQRQDLPESGQHAHLRILDPDGLMLGQFKLNMPPWRWYSRQLLSIEKSANPTSGTQRIQVRRDRANLELYTAVREVSTLWGGRILLSLTIPFQQDRFRPHEPLPGMFSLEEQPQPNQLLYVLWDGQGGIRSSIGRRLGHLPRPEPSATLQRRILGRDAQMLLLPGPKGTPHARKLAAIGVLSADDTTTFLDYVRLLMTFIAFSPLLFPLGLLQSHEGGRLVLGTERRIIGAFLVLSFIPLLWLAGLSHQRARTALEQSTVRDLSRALRSLRNVITERASGAELDPNLLDDAWCREVSDELGRLFYIYQDGRLLATSHPELTQIGLIPRRPPIRISNALTRDHQPEARGTLTLGGRQVPVGYAALSDDSGRVVGIVATPALAEHRARQTVLVRTTLLLLAVYGLVLLAVVICGLLLARWITRPVEQLLEGTRQVAGGNLEYQIDYQASNEFGELVHSFNSMTQDLLRLQEQALDDERSDAFRTMARQIAHEIKNPLTPMKLSTQHLRDAHARNHPKLPEIIEKTTHTLIEQIEALRRIATEFSVFAKFPRRQFEIVPLEPLLEEVCEMYDNFEGRITIVRRMSPSPTNVRVDRDEVRRIFINLFTNAIQAIPADGTIVVVTGRTHLAPMAVDAGNPDAPPFIETKLIDSGPGIPLEILTKIFRPNFSTKSSGTGLGLAICKKSISELGGEITIESQLNHGTTVSVLLPIHQEN